LRGMVKGTTVAGRAIAIDVVNSPRRCWQDQLLLRLEVKESNVKKPSLLEWTSTGDGSTELPRTDLFLDNLVSVWGGVPYAELSVVLVYLRYLAMVHQTHHWTSKGDPFWGDHKLFERLYETVVDEIDTVAEKAVGLGTEANVNLQLQVTQVLKLCKTYGTAQTVPTSSDLAKASLVAERRFLTLLDATSERMREQGIATPGVENMLQQLFDTHEKHTYLLKLRCSAPQTGF